MTTGDLLSTLRSYPDAALAFEGGGAQVPRDVHVTEIKAHRVRAMDCGGGRAEWGETVVQLWSPGRPDASAMQARKFLSIVERVAAAVPLDDSATVRVEYGHPSQPAVNYLIRGLEATEGMVRVRLAAPAVACKANEPDVPDLPMVMPTSEGPVAGSSSCCGPSSSSCCG